MVVGQHNITHSSHSTVVQCQWCGARHRVPGLCQHATLTFYQMTFVSWNWCLMELELLRSWWSCVLVMIGAQWYLVVPGTHHGHICQLRLSSAQLAAEHIPMSEQRSFHLHSKADSYKVTSNNHEYHFYTLWHYNFTVDQANVYGH